MVDGGSGVISTKMVNALSGATPNSPPQGIHYGSLSRAPLDPPHQEQENIHQDCCGCFCRRGVKPSLELPRGTIGHHLHGLIPPQE
jgi:hypothetical protein